MQPDRVEALTDRLLTELAQSDDPREALWVLETIADATRTFIALGDGAQPLRGVRQVGLGWVDLVIQMLVDHSDQQREVLAVAHDVVVELANQVRVLGRELGQPGSTT